MRQYLLKRLFGAALALLASSILVFLMLKFVPGDPVQVLAGPGARQEDIERLTREFGLDQPIHIQYFRWITNLLRGDWGRSIVSREPVLPMVISRFKNTLKLCGAGIAIAVGIGLPFGIYSALHRNTISDLMLTVLALAGISAPIFWLCLVLQVIFSVRLGWLPATGHGTISHLILPAVAVGTNCAGLIMRMTRSSMLEVIQQDYIRTARAKGCQGFRVVYRHALKNAMVPIVTVIGLQAAILMGGAVLTEAVFVWPGIGKLIVDSIFRRDYPMVQGAMLLTGSGFILVNLVADMLAGLVDPRIRLEAGEK